MANYKWLLFAFLEPAGYLEQISEGSLGLIRSLIKFQISMQQIRIAKQWHLSQTQTTSLFYKSMDTQSPVFLLPLLHKLNKHGQTLLKLSKRKYMYHSLQFKRLCLQNVSKDVKRQTTIALTGHNAFFALMALVGETPDDHFQWMLYSLWVSGCHIMTNELLRAT